jgi:hypothetical protein
VSSSLDGESCGAYLAVAGRLTLHRRADTHL